jgi:hypothetical protein
MEQKYERDSDCGEADFLRSARSGRYDESVRAATANPATEDCERVWGQVIVIVCALLTVVTQVIGMKEEKSRGYSLKVLVES